MVRSKGYICKIVADIFSDKPRKDGIPHIPLPALAFLTAREALFTELKEIDPVP